MLPGVAPAGVAACRAVGCRGRDAGPAGVASGARPAGPRRTGCCRPAAGAAGRAWVPRVRDAGPGRAAGLDGCRRGRRCGWSRGSRSGRGQGDRLGAAGASGRRQGPRPWRARRCLRPSRGRLLGRLAAAERLPQPARDGCFHRRGRRFDEFALITQASENFLTGDTEFPAANSCTRALPATTSPTQEATAVVGRASGLAYDAWSSGLHGVLMFFATCSLDRGRRALSISRSARPPRRCP